MLQTRAHDCCTGTAVGTNNQVFSVWSHLAPNICWCLIYVATLGAKYMCDTRMAAIFSDPDRQNRDPLTFSLKASVQKFEVGNRVKALVDFASDDVQRGDAQRTLHSGMLYKVLLSVHGCGVIFRRRRRSECALRNWSLTTLLCSASSTGSRAGTLDGPYVSTVFELTVCHDQTPQRPALPKFGTGEQLASPKTTTRVPLVYYMLSNMGLLSCRHSLQSML